MKRHLIACMIVLLIPVLGASAAGTQQAASTDGEVTISKVYSFSADRLPNEPVYEHKIVREKFGIVFDVEYVAQSAYTEKMNLYFASGNYPDYVYRAPNIQDVHRWAMEGHIRPMSDLFDRLPEYFANWTEEGWAEAFLFTRSPDGKLYFLPERRDYTHYMAWIYRADLFEEAGIEFPQTTEDLLAALDTLTDLYPDSTPIVNWFGIDMLWGFQLAFRTHKDVHVDIDTGELVYGPATDKYRDMLTFVNELYRRGYIDREWLTMQRSQWQEIHFVPRQ